MLKSKFGIYINLLFELNLVINCNFIYFRFLVVDYLKKLYTDFFTNNGLKKNEVIFRFI